LPFTKFRWIEGVRDNTLLTQHSLACLSKSWGSRHFGEVVIPEWMRHEKYYCFGRIHVLDFYTYKKLRVNYDESVLKISLNIRHSCIYC